MINDKTIQEIKDRVSIVDVVSEFVKLKKVGKNYAGICPFHPDKNPSFYVNPELGTYYCFGCGAKGDVISFLMEIKKLSFSEAVEELAERAGIKIEFSKSGDSNREEKEKLYRLNDRCLFEFYRILKKEKEGELAREYLKSRKVPAVMIDVFKLGFAPNDEKFIYEMLKKDGFSDDLIFKSGLVINGDRGVFGRFRGRLMFPIYDFNGRIAGFGGRILPEFETERTPKYINSSETIVFQKSRLLFGWKQTKDSIIKSQTVYVVEGYFDVIGLFSAGIKNVVAPLGTAVSENHIRFLSKYAKKIYLTFDGDSAGLKAAERAVDIAVKFPVDVKVVVLENGKDPFDIAVKEGKEAFLKFVNKSLDSVDFKLKVLTDRFSLEDRYGRTNIINSLFQFLAVIDSSVERFANLKKSAEILGIDYEILKKDFEEFIRKGVRKSVYERKDKVPSSLNLDINLLAFVMLNPELAFDVDDTAFDGLTSEVIKSFVSMAKKGEKFTESDVLSSLGEDEIPVFEKSLRFLEAETPDLNSFSRLLDALKLRGIKNKKKKIKSEIARFKKAGDKDRVRELLEDLQVLSLEELRLKSRRSGRVQV